jgi:hypothetical protein
MITIVWASLTATRRAGIALQTCAYSRKAKRALRRALMCNLDRRVCPSQPRSKLLVVSDGLPCFASVADAGCAHQVVKTGSAKGTRAPPFRQQSAEQHQGHHHMHLLAINSSMSRATFAEFVARHDLAPHLCHRPTRPYQPTVRRSQ